MKRLLFSALLIFFTNGCAYFSNINERPVELVEYNYYDDFYSHPLETTVVTTLQIPVVCVFAATIEPMDKAFFKEHFEKYPKYSITGLLYLPIEMLFQGIANCSSRLIDLLVFNWWLPEFDPNFRYSEEEKHYFKNVHDESPYIYDWL